MAVTFTTSITKKGNLKLDDFIKNCLNVHSGDVITLSMDVVARGGNLSDRESFICIPPSLLEEAGIEDDELCIYTEEGKIIITAWEEDIDE